MGLFGIEGPREKSARIDAERAYAAEMALIGSRQRLERGRLAQAQDAGRSMERLQAAAGGGADFGSQAIVRQVNRSTRETDRSLFSTNAALERRRRTTAFQQEKEQIRAQGTQNAMATIGLALNVASLFIPP